MKRNKNSGDEAAVQEVPVGLIGDPAQARCTALGDGTSHVPYLQMTVALEMVPLNPDSLTRGHLLSGDEASRSSDSFDSARAVAEREGQYNEESRECQA